ncbi:hypothetical protein PspLS_03763 [Pyricularia sp. CBS 133598]|nr:hypothetical protein PspLS_03763 [Pyricularia sp. CBS 133598]
MPREGTRSATGNSRPRVFQTVDTAPTITRKKPTTARTKKAPAAGAGSVTKAKTKAKAATAPKSAGVTKKKAAPKKATAGSKASCALCGAKAAVNKAEAKVKGKTAPKDKA